MSLTGEHAPRKGSRLTPLLPFFSCLIAFTFSVRALAGPDEMRLMLPQATSANVMALASGLEFVATGGDDQRIAIWHPGTGRQWRVLSGHLASLTALAFGLDNQVLVSGDYTGEVRLWSLPDGRNTCIWPASDPSFFHQIVHVHVSGNEVQSLSTSGLLRRFRINDCAELPATSLHDGHVRDALPAPDGWWLLGTRTLSRLAPDGTRRWHTELPADGIKLLAPPDIPGAIAVLLDNGTLRQFDPQGQAGPVIEHGLYGSTIDLALTPEGWAAVDGSLVLSLNQDRQTREIRPGEDAPVPPGIHMDRIAATGDTLVVAGQEGLLLLDRRSGALNSAIKTARSPYHNAIALSPDKHWLIEYGISGALLWDLQSGRPEVSLTLEANASVKVARFLPDARQLLLVIQKSSLPRQEELVLYDLEAGVAKIRRPLPDSMLDLVTDRQGQQAYVGLIRGGVAVFDLPSLESKRTLPTSSQPQWLRLDAPGNHLLIGNGNHAEVLDTTEGKIRWSIKAIDIGNAISAAELSPDGNTVWLSSADSIAALPVELDFKPRWQVPHSSGVQNKLVISPDGRRLALLGNQSAWIETATGQTKPIEQPSSALDALWYGNTHLLIRGSDGTTRLWHDHETKPFLAMQVLEHPGIPPCQDGICREIPPWVVTSADGRFDTQDFASLADLAVWYRQDQPLRPLPFEWLARSGFEPRLLRRTLATGLPPRKNPAPKRFEPPELRIAGITPSVSTPGALRIELEVKPRSTGLSEVQLRRNGRLAARIPGSRIPAPPPGQAAVHITLDPIRYTGRYLTEPLHFEALAYDTEGIAGTARQDHAPAFDSARWLASKSTTYLLNIGVNRHENSTFDLDYAANDADLIGARLSDRLRSEGATTHLVQIRLISDDRQNLATKANIREALGILSGRRPPSPNPALAGLQRAGPDDRIVISFAGHGLVDAENEFYLLPADTGPGRGRDLTPELLARAISSRELSDWLEELDADSAVLIIDACHAAAAVDAQNFVPGANDSSGLGQLAYDKGIAVLAATQADDVALESAQLRQGILSYALIIDGVERKLADHAPKDGRIGFIEWLRYATLRVPELSTLAKNGSLSLAQGSRGFNRLGQPKTHPDIAQKPTVFYFPRGRQDDTLLRSR